MGGGLKHPKKPFAKKPSRNFDKEDFSGFNEAGDSGPKKMKAGSFETMGLNANLLRAIKRKGYRLPTPIQRKTMPLILQGLDVVGMARTGSGKTAAFIIPMVQRLASHSSSSGVRAVILSPTRELALQTYKVFFEMAKFSDLRGACLVGGDSMEEQFEQLSANPDVIVATPGRLAHHLEEIDGFNLRGVQYVVFDEADRLFEMGFADQLRSILGRMSDTRQTMLFSATLPAQLAEFARAGLKEPQLIRLDTETKISPDLSLAFFTVRDEYKPGALLHLCREVIPRKQPTIIFVSTKHHVEYINNLLLADDISCAAVYGAMDQAARTINVGKFRTGKIQFLIVTDVAARGIDIPLLDNVINYDFPAKPKLFVHRAGRAARAGRPGTAYSFLTRDEIPFLLDLHLFLSRPIKTAPTHLDPTTVRLTLEGMSPEGGSLLGSFPQSVLDPAVEHWRHLHHDSNRSADLEALERPCKNAFKLYLKTRPPASLESVRRAKTLPEEGPHPFLAKGIPEEGMINLGAETQLRRFTEALKTFRPAQTVFETEVGSSRKASHVGGSTFNLKGDARQHEKLEVMRRKREMHGRLIQQTKSRKEHMLAIAGRPEEDEEEEGGDQLVNGGRDGESDASSSGSDDDDGMEGGEGEGDEGEEEAGPSKAPAPGSKRSQSQLGASSSGKGAKGGGGGGEAGPAPKRFKLLPTAIEAELVTGRYRDEDFYISSVPTNKHADEGYSMKDAGDRFKDAVLDLTGEDEDAMKQQKNRFHWDKRKKKYVKLSGTDEIKASGKRVVVTESGQRVQVEGRSGTYKEWVKRTHKKVAMGTGSDKGPAPGPSFGRGARKFGAGGRGGSGRDEGGGGGRGGGRFGGRFGGRGGGRGDRGDQGGRGDRGDRGGDRGGRSELKGKDQIRKERQLKERRAQYIKDKRAKDAKSGKKGGQKGGRGVQKGGRGGGGRGGGRR